MVVKIEFTPLSLDRKIVPFKKGFFLKSKLKSAKKLQQQTNKQQQTTIFSAKNKLSIFETNFTKFEGKVRFGQIFF